MALHHHTPQQRQKILRKKSKPKSPPLPRKKTRRTLRGIK